MNRLTKLLFAGTLVPAVALIPIAGAIAQTPDHDHGAPGDHHPGGPSVPPSGVTPHGGGAMISHGSMMRGEGAPPGAAAHPKAAEMPAGHALPMPHESKPNHTAEAPAAPAAPPQPNHTDATPAAPTPRAAQTAPDPDAHHKRDAMDPNAHHNGGMTGQTEHSSPINPPARDAAAPHANRPGDAAQNQHRNPADRPPDRRPNGPSDAPREDANRAPPPRGPQDANRGDGHHTPGAAVAIGVAAGFAGGFLAATGAQRLDDVRRDRRETVEDGRTYIREPGRTIVEDGNRSFIVHDENDRFRQLGYDVRRERHGNENVDIINRPGGVQIVTYTDADGRMLRRVRRGPDGREFILIDNGVDGRIQPYEDDVIDLPPPPVHVPRDRYVVDYQDADEGLIYDTLIAPPLAPPPQRYTLDQIRYSPDIRTYVRSVDINTINFDTGSWTVPGQSTGKLDALASAIKRAIARNPNSVFLVEGYTDAVGNPTDNLSLSDRRAQSVAAILTRSFDVPPENLTTQGYGQQNLKVNTSGPSAENRRVVVQNITQLLASGDRPPPQE